MTDAGFSAPQHLNESAQHLLNSILESHSDGADGPPPIDWWLHALLEARGPMAADLRPGLDIDALKQHLSERLAQPGNSAPLDAKDLAARAFAAARERGKQRASDRDVLAAALSFLDAGSDDAPAGAAPATTAGQDVYMPRLERPTPTLKELGVDFTQQAARGKLMPVLGREAEIEQVVETLCRAKKRNPALLGPAGVGKTAIVEGLAQRIVAGDVPKPLQGCALFSLSVGSLVAGAGVIGALEERLAAMLEEAAQDGVLLFIDEVHAIMGAGGRAGQGDVATLLKPALSRGDIACIVATTDVEYRQFITKDAALERRFNPVLVNEVSREITMAILRSFRDAQQDARHVAVDDEILEDLVRMADRFMRNRFFPDKALDLLDHCIAAAVTDDCNTVTAADARAIVQRRVGMPVDTAAGIGRLTERLASTDLLAEADLENLGLRLRSTTENLDLVPTEPNVSVLMCAEAAALADQLAADIAETVFGSAERVVSVDLARLTQDHHINVIVGSSAGYVGHGDPLPHDPVQQTPWCVVVWRNVDRCHGSIRSLLARIMQSGELADNRGQTTYFSDTVVIATAADTTAAGGGADRTIGFDATGAAPADPPLDRDRLDTTLGKTFLDQFDLIVTRGGGGKSSGKAWIEANLLAIAGERYAARGLAIVWDESFVAWLDGQREQTGNRKAWEGLLDRHLHPLLREILNRDQADRPRRVVVRHGDDGVVVEPQEDEEA